VSYVQTKVVKRLERFRVKNVEPGQHGTLLLPMSFGVSAVTLLHILDRQLQSQMNRTGRTGFALHVLHVIPPDEPEDEQLQQRYEAVKAQFPEHAYSSVELLNYQSGASDGFSSPNGSTPEVPPDQTLDGDFPSYATFLSSLPSVTSKTDVLSILKTRRIVEFARRNGCGGILWGDSTTRLAEKILAETAKGRGYSLPWQVADGDSPFGIPFYYPMRDLLKKELVSFVDTVSPSLRSLVALEPAANATVPAASKDSSIDLLMKQYFESVEEQYPSIVANVVRTTSKLELKASASAKQCHLCSMLVPDSPSGQNGDVGHGSAVNGLDIDLCYGCSTAVPPESRALIPHIP
jgi:cytoplasmic tRNA 2-thiolation protein 2